MKPHSDTTREVQFSGGVGCVEGFITAVVERGAKRRIKIVFVYVEHNFVGVGVAGGIKFRNFPGGERARCACMGLALYNW